MNIDSRELLDAVVERVDTLAVYVIEDAKNPDDEDGMEEMRLQAQMEVVGALMRHISNRRMASEEYDLCKATIELGLVGIHQAKLPSEEKVLVYSSVLVDEVAHLTTTLDYLAVLLGVDAHLDEVAGHPHMDPEVAYLHLEDVALALRTAMRGLPPNEAEDLARAMEEVVEKHQWWNDDGMAAFLKVLRPWELEELPPS